MATITFTNLTVSGNMGFKEISYDAFRRILDFVEAQTHGAIPTGTDLNDLSEGTWKEAEVTVQGKAAEVVVPDEEPAAAKEAVPKIDPYSYSLVGNYAGKDSVVRILKAYTENPEGYTQEWMTAKQWMEKVDLGSSATLFNIAHILSDCAKVGILERRADYNPEEHKNEVRFLLPVPVKHEEPVAEPVDEPNVTTEDSRRGDKVRAARMEAGFSVSELAELLHTDAGTVVKWETGTYRITGSVEEDLKKLFGNGLFDGMEE